MTFSKAQGRGESSWEELTRAIIKEVRGMPGNRECCDCSAPGESQPMAVGTPCFLPPGQADLCPTLCSVQLLETCRRLGSCPSPLFCCGACALGWCGADGEERQRMHMSLALLSLQILLGSPLTWAS